MANDIKGISVKIGADTTELKKALSGIDTQAKATQKELTQIGRQLKYDPTNTVLLTQKHQLLGQQIATTKEKLEVLKTAQDQFDESAKNTDAGAAQYRALEREVQKTESQLKNLNKQYAATSSVSMTLEKIAGGFNKVSEATGKAGTAMTKYVTAPIMAIGAASAAAWKSVDDGLDTVVEKTGATGAALEDMQERVKNIAESIPTDFSTAGEAIGEVNTRFGITGDALEELSTQFIKFAKLNNTDVSSSIDTVQKALSAFGLSSDDAGNLLDVLNKTAQDTGASVDTLTAGLVQNGTAFQEMGLSIEQSTVFMGQMEKSGANSETVMQGLRKALKNATADGTPLNEALDNLQNTIENGTGSVDGLTAAYDLFGKSGDQIYGAVKSGTLDFSDLADAVTDAGGSVANTYEETLDPADKLKVIMNQLKDLGYEIADTAGEMLVPAIQDLSDFLKDLKTRWDGLSDAEQKQIEKIALTVAAIGPALTIVSKVTGGIAGLVTNINTMQQAISVATNGAGAFSTILGALTSPIGLVVAGIAEITAAVVVLGQNTDSVNGGLGDMSVKFDEAVSSANSATGALSSAADSLDNITAKANDSVAAAQAQCEIGSQLVDELSGLESQTSLTRAEQEQMYNDVAMLNQLYPDLNLSIDETTGKLSENTDSIKENVQAANEAAMQQAYLEAYQDLIKEIAEAKKAEIEADLDLREAQESQNDVMDEAKAIEQAFAEQVERSNELRQRKITLEEEGKTSAKEYSDVTSELADLEEKISNNQVEYNGAIRQVSLNDASAAATKRELTKAEQEHADAVDKASAAQDAAKKKSSELLEILKEQGIEFPGLTTAQKEETAATEDAAAADSTYAAGSGEVSTANQTQIQSWADLRQTAIDSITSTSDTFRTYETDTEVTLDSMAQALQSQASAYNNYADNINTVMADSRYQTDQNFRAMADSIMQMGINGADYMQQFVNAINGDGTQLAAILQDYGNMTDAKNRYADNIASMEYYTQDGVNNMVSAVSGASGEMASAAGNTAQAGADAVQAREGQYSSAGSQSAQNYASGIGSQKGNVTSTAQGVADSADRSMQLNKTYQYGSAVGVSYASGISSQYGNAQSAARGIANGASGALQGANAYTWGSHLGSGFASGISSQYGNVVSAARSLASAASAYLHHTTPDEGPLKGDDQWGTEFAQNFAKGVRDNIRAVRSATQQMANAVILPDLEPQDRLLTDAASLANGMQADNSRIESVLLAVVEQQETIRAMMQRYLPGIADRKIVLDSNTLVGELAPAMDVEMGRMMDRRRRGN